MKDKRGHDRFFFADCHKTEVNPKKNNVNTEQRKDFIEAAQQLNATSIVEDSFVYNTVELYENFAEYNNNDYTCFPFKIALRDNNETMLGGLTALCTFCNIPVTNVEFRFCTCSKANMQKLYDLYARVYEEIQQYQDGPQLTEIYTQQLALCTQVFNNAMVNLAQFLKNTSPQTLWSKIMTALDLEPDMLEEQLMKVGVSLCALLDLRILHLLENDYKDHKTVFIATGGAHTYNLVQHLTKLGYTIEHTYGSDAWMFEPPALNIRESFKEFGISIQEQKTSLIMILLKAKIFFERNKFIFNPKQLTNPILRTNITCTVNPAASKNQFVAWLLWFIMPSPLIAIPSLIDYVSYKPIKRK